MATPNSLFLPSTFEERGAIAPFTTPELAMCRVRPDDRHGLVLLMPNFGGTDGAFIVPWAAVTDVITLSVHDRALYEAVLEARAVTPDAVRIAALKVARTGLAGPLAAKEAQTLLDAEEGQYLETHFLLILALLGSLRMDTAGLFRVNSDSDEWRDLVRTMLHQVGVALKIEVNVVYERLERLARILTPIGVASARQEGRLRRLIHKLAEFRDSLRSWSESDPSDIASYGLFAVEVAELTISIATTTFRSLDAAIADIPIVIGRWHKEVPIAERAAARLSWLLDGWDRITGMWVAASNGTPDEQREKFALIRSVLPLIPRDEHDWGDHDLKERHELFQRKRVLAGMDWRTGRYDPVLMRRYDAARMQENAPAGGMRGKPR